MPRIARPRAGLSSTAIIIGAVMAGILLFTVLDARRRALSAPAVRPARADLVGASQALPALYIPPVRRALRPVPLPAAPAIAVQLTPPSRPQAAPAPITAPSVPSPPQSYGPPSAPHYAAAYQRRGDSVIDSSQAPASADARRPPQGGGYAIAGEHRRPQPGRRDFQSRDHRAAGTLIPAVLETALDLDGVRVRSRTGTT